MSITAPASAVANTRATADNGADVTVQVNKGASWAVAKIQVKAVEVVDSYYAVYNAGGNLSLIHIYTLAIVKGQWKYIEPSDAPAIEYWTRMELGNDRQPQLYDLSSDPSEKNNVAKLHPEAVRELSELLKSVKTR